MPRRVASRCTRLAAVSLIAPLLAPGCDRSPGGPIAGAARLAFSDVTEEVGIEKPSRPWPDGRYRIPEISAGGVGIFDHDLDGDLDIYLVCHPPPDDPGAPAPNRLFAQESPGRFREVPGAAGLDDAGYGCGAAVGDVEGDGDLDVYVANVGADALYLSDGGRRFTNATVQAGLGDDQWSSSAAFFDADRDGDLDLFVTRYLVDDPSRVCRPAAGAPRDYCGPARYQGVPDLFYRNAGDGTFTDATELAGIRDAWPGFGVVCADFTGDGWADVYVANDKKPNQLWVNRRNGTFADEAVERGVAFGGNGEVEAGMGVAADDLNGDARLDLFVTNLAGETHALYLSEAGGGVFRDRSAASGIGSATLLHTGWGCGFADFDLDGDLDLAVANGRIERGPVDPRSVAGPFWSAYAETSQLFENQGMGRFIDVSALAGDFAGRAEVSRGLALGDLDGDGDVDLVRTDVGNGIRVFRNDSPRAGRHWLRVRALTGKRDAFGAVVRLEAGGTRQTRPLLSASGFSSANEPAAHFGLGATTSVDRLEVEWPSGKVERFAVGAVDCTVTVREGQGAP